MAKVCVSAIHSCWWSNAFIVTDLFGEHEVQELDTLAIKKALHSTLQPYSKLLPLLALATEYELVIKHLFIIFVIM